MKTQKQEPYRIKGVHIDLENSSVKAAKSMTAIRKLNIFSHFEVDERNQAEKELAAKLGITESEPANQNQSLEGQQS